MCLLTWKWITDGRILLHIEDNCPDWDSIPQFWTSSSVPLCVGSWLRENHSRCWTTHHFHFIYFISINHYTWYRTSQYVTMLKFLVDYNNKPLAKQFRNFLSLYKKHCRLITGMSFGHCTLRLLRHQAHEGSADKRREPPAVCIVSAQLWLCMKRRSVVLHGQR
jgi:hypothetical protein